MQGFSRCSLLLWPRRLPVSGSANATMLIKDEEVRTADIVVVPVGCCRPSNPPEPRPHTPGPGIRSKIPSLDVSFQSLMSPLGIACLTLSPCRPFWPPSWPRELSVGSPGTSDAAAAQHLRIRRARAARTQGPPRHVKRGISNRPSGGPLGNPAIIHCWAAQFSQILLRSIHSSLPPAI